MQGGSRLCHHPYPQTWVWNKPFGKAKIFGRKKIKRDSQWFSCFCVRAKSSLQSCLMLCDPMDCSPPGSSVHGILQARILERVAMPSSRGSSWPRDQTWVSCIAGRFFTAEPPGKPWHVYTTRYKIDNYWEPTTYVQHRELYSVLCGGLMGRKSKKEGICVYI